jgi:poly(3-hydroxybutyrate) depolymerase
MCRPEGAFHLDDCVNYVQEFIRHLQGKYGNCHASSASPTHRACVRGDFILMASRGENPAVHDHDGGLD